MLMISVNMQMIECLDYALQYFKNYNILFSHGRNYYIPPVVNYNLEKCAVYIIQLKFTLNGILYLLSTSSDHSITIKLSENLSDCAIKKLHTSHHFTYPDIESSPDRNQ